MENAWYANLAQPTIPSEFASFVSGIASLDNLPKHRSEERARVFQREGMSGQVNEVAAVEQNLSRPNFTYGSTNQTYYALTPYDFATLYDVLPLWNANAPVNGAGETIAVVGETDINPADFVSFRTLFSLPLGSSANETGSSYLNIIYNGSKPSVFNEEGHAIADVEWAGAAAPGAVIDYVASQSTEVSSGVALSAAYIVDNNLAPILVDSYSTCELSLGSGGNAFYDLLWSQAAAQGITVVTASGDSGAAGCDANYTPASEGKAVNGVASTQYDVAVGGTDFYLPNGPSGYFSATNRANQSSVLSYIPEAVWNDNCTNPLILTQPQYAGASAEQVCNLSSTPYGLSFASGSGGGASACTSSDGSTVASCSGGHPKPSWQVGNGVPNDGLRDVPDVALFASKGRANSFYVVCQQSANTDGNSCNVDTPYSDFVAAGGTELAAPAFAGILALAAQKTGDRLGNVNPVLYGLAAKQAVAGTACGSSTPNSVCLFHDVSLGTNSVPCTTGSPTCVTQNVGDRLGTLNVPAAGAGYDLATGLGSVDAAQLVTAWAALSYKPTTALLTLSPTTGVHGSPVSVNVVVSGQSVTPTGLVAIQAQSPNGLVASGPLNAGTFTQVVRSLPGGSFGVSAHYAGDTVDAATDSNVVSVVITPEPSTSTLTPLAYDPVGKTGTAVASAPYGTVFYLRVDVQGQSGQGIATGAVTLTDNGAYASGTVSLNSSGSTEAQTSDILPGNHTLSSTYLGDASFNPSVSAPVSLVITKAPTSAVLTESATSVASSGFLTFTATVDSATYGLQSPSGPISLLSGSLLIAQVTPVTTQDSNYHTEATGIFTLPASSLPVGQNSLTIVFNGDANYTGSTSAPISVNVINASLPATKTTVSSTPASVPMQGAAQLYAQVDLVASGQPAGQVQFQIDGRNLAATVTLAGGIAAMTYPVGSLAAGQHLVQAVFLGSATAAASISSPVSLTITSPTLTSKPTFTITPAIATQGTPVAVVAQVASSTGLVATGTMQIFLDGNQVGQPYPLTSGAAMLPLETTAIPVGKHVLTVYYSGDQNFRPGSADPGTLTISTPSLSASSITLSGLATLVPFGMNATAIATVSPVNPVPSGTLQVAVDGVNSGATVLLGGPTNMLTLLTSALTPGTHTVSVSYSGDSHYTSSSSAPAAFVVGQPVSQGTFSLTPGSVSLSADRLSLIDPTVTYLVSPNGFTGSVAFSCSGNLPTYTACSFLPSTLSVQDPNPASTVLTLKLNTGLNQQAQTNGLLRQRKLIPLSFAGFFGALFFFRRSRRLPAMLSLLFLAALAGCGNGYPEGTSSPGTYQIVVTAIGGGVTHTDTISLTVK